MILFGHLGIGIRTARPFWKTKWGVLPCFALALGTLAPDLLDKSLFYLGGRGDFICGTRTLGHCVLFPLLLYVGARFLSAYRPVLLAFLFGIISHLVLDHLDDGVGQLFFSEYLNPGIPKLSFYARMQGLFWPFLGGHFPIYPHSGMGGHLATWKSPHLWGPEIIGAYLLWRDRR